MAWIELHQSLPTNKKTIRLKNLLQIKTPQAVGHLCILWLWALDNAPDGDLSTFTDDEIAEFASWSGKNADEFVKALKKAGFVDDGMGLHDWSSYAGKLVEKRKSDAERKRMSRKYSGTSAGRPTDTPQTGANFPCDGAGNRTVPNRTVPNSTSFTAVAVKDAHEDAHGDDGNDKLKMFNGSLGRGVVMLTDEQLDDLLAKIGDVEIFNSYVSKLADFIISKSAKVASHYHTILKWYTEDCGVAR